MFGNEKTIKLIEETLKTKVTSLKLVTTRKKYLLKGFSEDLYRVKTIEDMEFAVKVTRNCYDENVGFHDLVSDFHLWSLRSETDKYYNRITCQRAKSANVPWMIAFLTRHTKNSKEALASLAKLKELRKNLVLDAYIAHELSSPSLNHRNRMLKILIEEEIPNAFCYHSKGCSIALSNWLLEKDKN